MYRPPNTNISDFLEIFKYQMNKINNTKCECIIGLDHNLDLLKQSRHPKTQKLPWMHFRSELVTNNNQTHQDK